LVQGGSMTKISKILFTAFVLLLPFGIRQTEAQEFIQQPTLAIPTVTGTPTGSVIQVATDNDQLNVRSGPTLSYPEVGILIAGEEVNAVGVSIGQDWIQIEYLGVVSGKAWVISKYVFFIKGNVSSLPVVEAPLTPTPQSTPTLDPILAAEFGQVDSATSVPTFTPPAPLVIATFLPSSSEGSNQFPTGILILSFLVLGLGGGIVSILRRR
jgi:hypothetical protein